VNTTIANAPQNAMDQSQDFKSLQEQVQKALISTTGTAGQISSEDLGFQRSFNAEVGTALDEQNSRLLALSTNLLKSAASISELRAPVLEDADDVENNWRSVVDVIDSLLEKADTCLDEYTGMIKRKEQPNVDQVCATRHRFIEDRSTDIMVGILKEQVVDIG
jgi:exosome complex exonuclease RRP6